MVSISIDTRSFVGAALGLVIAHYAHNMMTGEEHHDITDVEAILDAPQEHQMAMAIGAAAGYVLV